MGPSWRKPWRSVASVRLWSRKNTIATRLLKGVTLSGDHISERLLVPRADSTAPKMRLRVTANFFQIAKRRVAGDAHIGTT